MACDGPATGLYDAGSSDVSGTSGITGFEWFRDGEYVGRGTQKTIEFPELGESVVRAAFVENGDSLASASKPVRVEPAPLEDCVENSFIWGDPGHMWDGDVSASYALRGSDAPSAHWKLLLDGEVVEDLGVQGRMVDVRFSGPGEFTLRANVDVGDQEHSFDYVVGVRDDDPLADPGRLGMSRAYRTDADELFREFRYMDAETGYLTAPLFVTADLLSLADGACTEDLLVVKYKPNRDVQYDMVYTTHYGEIVGQITDTEGSERNPDIHQGVIVFTNDTRSGLEYDELSLYSGGTARYMTPEIDTLFSGFSPRFDRTGMRIALGNSRVNIAGTQERNGIKIVERHTMEWRPLQNRPFEEIYGEPVEGAFHEGAYIDWHPRADTLVYTVNGFTDGAFRQIWMASADGSQVEYLVDGTGGPTFSPSGDYLFFGTTDENAAVDTNVIRMSDRVSQKVADGYSTLGYCGPDEYY